MDIQKLHSDVGLIVGLLTSDGMPLSQQAWEYMRPLLSGEMSCEEHEQWLLELLAKESAV